MFKNLFLFLNIFTPFLNGYILNNHLYSFDYSIQENNKIKVNTYLDLKQNNFYEINFYDSYSVVGYIKNDKPVIKSYDEFPIKENNNYIFENNIKLQNNNLLLNFTSYFDNYNIVLYTGKYNLTYFEPCDLLQKMFLISAILSIIFLFF